MEYALQPFRRFFDFKRRARRKEYWLFYVADHRRKCGDLRGRIRGGLAPEFGNGPISGIFALVTFIPSIAVLTRRLHDTDRSGWWILAILAPLLVLSLIIASGPADPSFGGLGFGGLAAVLAVVAVVVTRFVFTVLDGTEGLNRFGPDPKRPDAHLDDVFA